MKTLLVSGVHCGMRVYLKRQKALITVRCWCPVGYLLALQITDSSILCGCLYSCESACVQVLLKDEWFSWGFVRCWFHSINVTVITPGLSAGKHAVPANYSAVQRQNPAFQRILKNNIQTCFCVLKQILNLPLIHLVCFIKMILHSTKTQILI